MNQGSSFQNWVSDAQFINKSILDITTKLSEQTARLDRAVFKSVTHCGCVKISAEKQIFDSNKSIEENKENLKTHLHGSLCEKCKEKTEEEMGDLLYYLASLCEALELDLGDVIEKKQNYIKTLGVYSLL